MWEVTAARGLAAIPCRILRPEALLGVAALDAGGRWSGCQMRRKVAVGHLIRS